jgi:hypothetical protein
MKTLSVGFTLLMMTVLYSSCSLQTPPANNSQSTTIQTIPTHKLGDLSSFRLIITDTLSLVEKNDLSGGKTRIKDLELAWDSAEAGLKPRSPSDWHIVDGTIDTALKALRATTPNQADCKEALQKLLKVMENTGK